LKNVENFFSNGLVLTSNEWLGLGLVKGSHQQPTNDKSKLVDRLTLGKPPTINQGSQPASQTNNQPSHQPAA